MNYDNTLGKVLQKGLSVALSATLLLGALPVAGAVNATAQTGGTAYRSIAAGGYHSFAVKADGKVKVTGYEDTQYQFSKDLPQDAVITAGAFHAVAYVPNGTIAEQVGTTGLNLDTGATYKQISAGGVHTVGIKADGTVTAVGNPSAYTDGQGTSVVGKTAAAVAAGEYHTVLLHADGTVSAYGDNSYGQGEVSGWTGVAKIAAGGKNTAAVTTDGRLLVAGDDTYGQVSQGNGMTNVQDVAVGYDHIVVLKQGGTVEAFGNNTNGQYQVAGWSDVTAISASYWHTLALNTEGKILAAGYNKYNQLGVQNIADVKNITVIPGYVADAELMAVFQVTEAFNPATGTVKITVPSAMQSIYVNVQTYTSAQQVTGDGEVTLINGGNHTITITNGSERREYTLEITYQDDDTLRLLDPTFSDDKVKVQNREGNTLYINHATVDNSSTFTMTLAANSGHTISVGGEAVTGDITLKKDGNGDITSYTLAAGTETAVTGNELTVSVSNGTTSVDYTLSFVKEQSTEKKINKVYLLTADNIMIEGTSSADGRIWTISVPETVSGGKLFVVPAHQTSTILENNGGTYTPHSKINNSQATVTAGDTISFFVKNQKDPVENLDRRSIKLEKTPSNKSTVTSIRYLSQVDNNWLKPADDVHMTGLTELKFENGVATTPMLLNETMMRANIKTSPTTEVKNTLYKEFMPFHITTDASQAGGDVTWAIEFPDGTLVDMHSNGHNGTLPGGKLTQLPTHEMVDLYEMLLQSEYINVITTAEDGVSQSKVHIPLQVVSGKGEYQILGIDVSGGEFGVPFSPNAFIEQKTSSQNQFDPQIIFADPTQENLVLNIHVQDGYEAVYVKDAYSDTRKVVNGVLTIPMTDFELSTYQPGKDPANRNLFQIGIIRKGDNPDSEKTMAVAYQFNVFKQYPIESATIAGKPIQFGEDNANERYFEINLTEAQYRSRSSAAYCLNFGNHEPSYLTVNGQVIIDFDHEEHEGNSHDYEIHNVASACPTCGSKACTQIAAHIGSGEYAQIVAEVPSSSGEEEIYTFEIVSNSKLVSHVAFAQSELKVTSAGAIDLLPLLTVDTLTAPAEKLDAVTFESSNPEVAVVNSEGKLVPGKNGTATITARVKSNSNISASMNVEVSISSSSGSSGNSSSSKPQTPSKPGEVGTATTTVTPTVDKNGQGTASVSSQSIDTAIREAKKNGSTDIGLVLDVTSKEKMESLSVSLPKAVQDKLLSAKVQTFTVKGDGVKMTFDAEALRQMTDTAKGEVKVRWEQVSHESLPAAVRTAVDGRPVVDLSVLYGENKTVSSFGKGRVSVAIPYILKANEKAENVIALYIDDDNKIHQVEGAVYDAKAQVLRFETDHFSLYAVGYQAEEVTFSDVENHWAKEAITFVATRGLMNGTGENAFSPDMSLSRGMFVTILGRMAGADVTGYEKSSFTDVGSQMYYAPYVEWAAEKGIANGLGNQLFAPDANLTREQLTVMLNNYAKVMGISLPEQNAPVTFADEVQISDWAKTSVQAMQVAGIIGGKAENRFDPSGLATRAEACTMLMRFVKNANI